LVAAVQHYQLPNCPGPRLQKKQPLLSPSSP
jgi:hypothetical protein